MAGKRRHRSKVISVAKLWRWTKGRKFAGIFDSESGRDIHINRACCAARAAPAIPGQLRRPASIGRASISSGGSQRNLVALVAQL